MINNLINPFIVYWDINASASDEDIMRVCDELVKAKIFVLDLRDMSLPLSNATFKTLNRLSSEQIKIKLTADRAILKQSMESLKDIRLFIEVDSFEHLQTSLDDILELINRGYKAGVSFYLNKRNFRELPAFVSLCIENNIKNTVNLNPFNIRLTSI